MPATLYFGAPVKPNQSAHKEALDQGLDLLRASPSEVVVTCYKDYKQPGHTIFSNNLAAFIYLSQNPGNHLSSQNPIYHPLSSKTVSPTLRNPMISFSFSRSLNSDQIDEIKRETGSMEAVSGKKLSFRHQYRDAALFQKILQLPGLLRTTQVGTTELNINGYRVYLFLHRLFDAFMKCNQYPGFLTNSKDDAGTFENFTIIAEKMKEESNILDSGDTIKSVSPNAGVYEMFLKGMQFKPVVSKDDSDPGSRNIMFHCNLSTPVVTYTYTIASDAQLSTNMTGLSLPYSTALTKTDYGVIPRVIQRYFLGVLGVSKDLAMAEFDEVKSSWGNICKTPWGDELAHMYRGVEIALDAQATIRVVETSEHVYRGLILYGGMYTLQVRDKLYTPVSRAELVVELANSNPHVSALAYIYSNISYPSQTGRDQAKAAARSIRDINLQIQSQGALTTAEQEMVRRAHHLSFPGQGEYLAATSFNIINVFTAIGDSSISEMTFPLHPDAILSLSRTERLLSAFGTEIPVFRVPGGKAMKLEGRFSVSERGADGKPEDRDIHSIGAILLPLKDAYPAFKEMKESKKVLNPYGSRLASQASSNSRIKKWEKESGDNVIAALRKSINVSVNAPSKGDLKRAAESDDLDDRGGKRSAAFDFF